MYVHYHEETGEILGIYPLSIDYDEVPEPKIEISDEELEILSEGNCIVENGHIKLESEYSETEIISPSTSEEDEGTEYEIIQNPELPDYPEILTVQDEYKDNLTRLKDAYLSAQILGNSDMMKEIQGEYLGVLQEFTGTVSEMSGQEGRAREYCPLCGTLERDGICPKCGYEG